MWQKEGDAVGEGVSDLGELLQQVGCTPVLSRMVNKLETCMV
jgi:hypothetical protein